MAEDTSIKTMPPDLPKLLELRPDPVSHLGLLVNNGVEPGLLWIPDRKACDQINQQLARIVSCYGNRLIDLARMSPPSPPTRCWCHCLAYQVLAVSYKPRWKERPWSQFRSWVIS